MSGRRLSSYRKGDWNEDLGILLLKLLAAVAPIPRQEDFGLDAIGTLLKPPQDNLVYAEQSFYIQLKSESKKTITYRDHELDWLRNLQLPLFIGAVSRKYSSLNFFPAHKLNEFFVLRDLKNLRELTIKLDDDGAKRKVNGESCELSIGPPLLSINITQASDSSFLKKAYQILEKYIRLEHQNILTRPLRYYRHIKWETNKKASSSGHLVALRRDFLKDDLFDAYESMVPGFELIKIYSESEDKELGRKLNSLINHLRNFFTTPEQIGDSGYIEWQDPFTD